MSLARSGTRSSIADGGSGKFDAAVASVEVSQRVALWGRKWAWRQTAAAPTRETLAWRPISRPLARSSAAARRQDVAPMRAHLRHDRHDLFRGLALAEDRFGVALAQVAVMVHLGKAEILEWQRPEPDHRVLRGNITGSDGCQQGFQFFRVHRGHLSINTGKAPIVRERERDLKSQMTCPDQFDTRGAIVLYSYRDSHHSTVKPYSGARPPGETGGIRIESRRVPALRHGNGDQPTFEVDIGFGQGRRLPSVDFDA